jgi:hypothetical protein
MTGRRAACATLCVLALLTGAQARGQEQLAAVRERLATSPVLRGEFEQEKALRGFRNPLRSQGTFLLAREQGIIWRTEEPFPSTVVLTPERIMSRRPDGPLRIELEATDQPGLGAVHALLFALIGGDLDALQTQFDAEAVVLGDDGWRLSLVPRAGPTRRFVGHIELEGDAHVESVRIDEAGGDRTSIRFTDVAGDTALTSDELDAFGATAIE